MSRKRSTKSVSIAPYLFKRKTDFFYNPPVKAVEAGVVVRKSFQDKSEALLFAKEQNALYQAWLKHRRESRKPIHSESTIEELINDYLNSASFLSLKEVTRDMYVIWLNSWKEQRVASKTLWATKMRDLSTPMVQRIYNEQVKIRSATNTNNILTMYSAVYNYGIRCGYVLHNPFTFVKRQRVKSRKVMWQREHVRAFLNTAFSQFEWRSIGLITYMLYEWGQRPKDICELKWSNIDFDKQIVVIEQSKRGATVKLPISTGLFEMLKQQHHDIPTSEYVAPLRKRWGKWMPYTAVILSRHFHAVAKLAKLPDDLQLRDLRRTAITESIEGGAEMVHIMQMSGHKSIDSLNPYVVHTLRGSTRAQEMRQFPDRLLEE